MAESVYIIDGARTAIGSFLGTLSALTAPELGAAALKGVLDRTGVAGNQIDEVYMGCVVQGGIGQAPARQAMIKAGIPDSVSATTVNKVCSSGLKAVMHARADILAGEANLALAGGMESMSQTPYILQGARKGFKLGHQQMQDLLISDGLWDPYGDVHMGNCAERCAEKYQFTQAQQDEFAATSYRRSLASLERGTFKDEVVPVSIPQRKGDPIVVTEDEEPKRGDVDKLSSLRPAFEKTGTITAGNASTINDGAAALLVASEKAVQQHNLKPMARIVSVATFSHEPVWFTTAPAGAIPKALEKAGLSLGDIDLFEINEAFAVVILAVTQELGIDINKVNINGGAVSLGHPIGASGARILVSLIHELRRSKKRYGCVAICNGGGEATAMIVENVTL